MKKLILGFLLGFGILFGNFALSFSNYTPHYFSYLGLSKCEKYSNNPLEFRSKLLTVLTQTRAMWPVATESSEGWISVPNIVGTGIWTSIISHGKEVKVYFRDYRQENGKYYFYDARGIHEISKQDFDNLVLFVKDYVDSAVDFSWKILQPLLNSQDKRPELEKEVKVKQGITLTLKSILSLPEIHSEYDLVPNELFFGPISPWGMVYLGTYGDYNRRVFIHPEAVVYDCMIGKPLVLVHELNHAQPTMQWLPLSYYVDVEILAELSSGLYEDFFWELTHPYLAVLNDLIDVAFGYSYFNSGGSFDFRSETAGLVWPNPDRIKEHQKIWEKIAPEIRAWVKEDLLPQLYKDPLYAMSVNMKYCWDSAFVAISFLSRFELAGLDGYENTQNWLAQNEKVIEQTWEKALEKTGDAVDVKDSEEFANLYPNRTFCPQPFSFSMMQNKSVKLLVSKIREDYINNGKEFVLQKLLRGGYRVSLGGLK